MPKVTAQPMNVPQVVPSPSPHGFTHSGAGGGGAGGGTNEGRVVSHTETRVASSMGDPHTHSCDT